MRIIPIDTYNEQTMKLAKPVFDRFRRILLAANSTIHPKYIEKMKEMGIRSLFVEDAESKGITMDEMIDMPTWMDVIQVLTEVHTAAQTKKPINLLKLNASVGQLTAEVKRRPILLPINVNAMPDEVRPFAHAVNVALLALQIGKSLGYNDIMLRDLGLGCLLHDIGKAATNDEKKHPEEGFNILRGIRELNLLSAHVAFQHHETLDGKGYPRGINGSAFHEYAQICGICNLFENMTSDKNMPTHDVMEFIMAQSGTGYRADIVDAFVRVIPSYPPGTLVQMDNGRNAIVVQITSHMQRPTIRYIDSGEEVSLAENTTLMITKSFA